MNWPPGAAVKKHVFSSGKPVLHKRKAIALSGHDLGPQLPHVPIGPGVLTAMMTLPSSSRKVLYTASTVQMCGSATGAVSLGHFNPMLVCGEITGLGDNVSNDAHSVFVGLTELDRLAGAVEGILTIAVDTAMFIASVEGSVTKPESPVPSALDVLHIDVKKSLISAGIALAKSAIISEESGWKTPITVPFEVGGSYASGNVQAEYNPATKTWTADAGVKAKGRTAKVSAGSDQDPSATVDDDFGDAAKELGHQALWGEPL